MITVLDYGPFSWKKFLKMLTENFSFNVQILPKPSFNLGWGSIAFNVYTGKPIGKFEWYRRYPSFIDLSFYFVSFQLSWWAHDPEY